MRYETREELTAKGTRLFPGKLRDVLDTMQFAVSTNASG